ncbi:MAG TPA: class I SAM-dependent methyltransferase [Tepidisphaeraceae bacterium]|nr:class I SAM-dependent methyltransferase [Tepidisphaeraceae bacterium]
MHLRTGIPLLTELDAHLNSDAYRRHVEFNRDFLEKNDAAMSQYGKLWAKDTFRLWSRRWEYPFVMQRLVQFAERAGDGPFRVLDAGSGVTYFPYYLRHEVPRSEVTCFDSNSTYHPMFAAVNQTLGETRVKFVEGWLQKLPFDDKSFDAVCCISVLEHTSNYGEILDEFARVLRPGGLLVLTFDLSLDGRFELPRAVAADLLSNLSKKFNPPDGVDVQKELSRMENPEREGILTTDHVRKTQPDLLPWKHPVLKAAHDLVKGHGWTGGFRSKSVYCVDVTAK